MSPANGAALALTPAPGGFIVPRQSTPIRRLFLLVCVSLLVSTLASAQSLAGNVRDTSGAVLPGVTVEASSPALIEKVRTAVADGNGQYQITNLPPGNYKIAFSLPGFATVVREGVELSGAGVTSINAEMRVGSLEESITVTGETPVVDVQSARQTTVINGDVVRALPASRSYGNYLAAVPAIQATGFNTGVATSNNFFTARGGRSNEGAIQIDGLNVGSPGNGGGVSGYLYDMNNSAEVQVSISGGLGESDRGAPVFNIIPKTGGNTFHGNYFGSFAGQWGQSSNIDAELTALGFADSPALRKSWDNNFSIGGPIWKDRIWFYANTRTIGTHLDTQNQYANKNAGNANEWRWVRDESIRVRNATSQIGQQRSPDEPDLGAQQDRLLPRLHEELQRLVVHNRQRPVPQPQPRRRLDGVGPGIGPGVADHLAGVGQYLERTVEDLAADVEFTVHQPHAVRGRMVVVLDAVGRR